LSDGDGVKYLYAQFIFDDGTQSGFPATDNITLDTRARIDSVYFRPPSTVFTPGSAIEFRMRTGESGGAARISFPAESGFALYDDGTGIDSTATVLRLCGRPHNDGQVSGSFTDAAQSGGHWSSHHLNIVPVVDPSR
jgi:hypothetical protein